MRALSRLRYRLRTLFGRASLERDLEDELQFHLEMQAAAYVQDGVAPAAAYTMARRQFGSVAQHKDDYRDRWAARVLETWQEDIRRAVRSLQHQPMTALGVVVAVALGLGMATAVFAVVEGVVLRPPPFDDPEQVVRLQAETALGERLFSVPELADLRSDVRGIEGLAEFHEMYFILLDGEQPRRVAAGVVSSNFFSVAGMRPYLGRTLQPDDEVADGPGALVISHRFWQSELGADPHVLGRTFRMNDRVHRVVGVLPAVPAFPTDADVYLPTTACPLRMSVAGREDRRTHLVRVLARVAPAASFHEVRESLSRSATRLTAAHPDTYADGLSLTAVGAGDDLVWRFRPALTVLVASASLLLASLVSSIGALMTARILPRRTGLFMQHALGAWRGRLFRQCATEGVVLALFGAVLSVVVAKRLMPPLVALAAEYTPRAPEIRFGTSTIAFPVLCALVLAVFAGTVMLALVPSNGPANRWRQGAAAGQVTTFRWLVALQIGVSCALLYGAGLTIHSVRNMQTTETGFDAEGVVTMRLSMDFIRHQTPGRRLDMLDAVLDNIRRVEGVNAAAVSVAMPFVESGRHSSARLEVGNGRQVSDITSVQVVSPGFFRTVGLPVLRGGDFPARTAASPTDTVVINERLAELYWGTGDPLGRRLRLGDGPWLTVVGVVANARHRLDVEPGAEVFLPLGQEPPVQATIFVRTDLALDRVIDAVDAAVRAADPGQPLDSRMSFDDARVRAIAPARAVAVLVAVFALIATVVALLGIAGVANASVSARVPEFGVRAALGATPGRLVRSVLWEGLRVTLAALVPGTLLAALLSQVLRTQLFEVEVYDPLAITGSIGIVLLVTLASCLAPALRAARVDPAAALRVG